MTNKSTKPHQIDHTRTVLKFAFQSRLLILTLITLWRYLLSPYDTSALLNPNCLLSSSNSPDSSPPVDHSVVLWPSIASVIEGSIVWDGVYFVRIAQCGYEYEQSYAFLPLLPVCINLLSTTVFRPLIPLIGHRAVLGLSGYVINNIAFLFAALYFYKLILLLLGKMLTYPLCTTKSRIPNLTCKCQLDGGISVCQVRGLRFDSEFLIIRLSVIILKDPEASLRASILFCSNPASIFYSSIYTESLYSLFSFGGLYYLVSGANNTAVLWLALSSSARSNGVINAGYICFQTMHQAYDAVFLKKRACLAVQVLLAGALRCICICVPFIAFQAYGYYNICLGHLPDETRPWCKARLPLLYNYIQSQYWGVGFLRYFQFKQLPNFLLASPILSLTLCSIIHYVKLQPELFFSVGFRASIEEKVSVGMSSIMGTEPITDIARFSKIPSSSIKENQNLRRRKTIKGEDPDSLPVEYEQSTLSEYSSAFIVPFVLHLGFMAATSFLVMHVQVSTRFLSASPPVYWFASYLMVSPGYGKRWGYLIWAYSAAYILLGSLLFSNFYPFT